MQPKGFEINTVEDAVKLGLVYDEERKLFFQNQEYLDKVKEYDKEQDATETIQSTPPQ